MQVAVTAPLVFPVGPMSATAAIAIATTVGLLDRVGGRPHVLGG